MALDPKTIDIVPVGTAEAAVLAPIHAACFAADRWNEPALVRLLRAEAARAFGAFAGYERAPLGFVLAFAAADEAEILTLAVAPAHRRAGIGRRLIGTLADALREEGIANMVLEVADDNVAAVGLYRRLGFVETGRRRGYYARTDGPPVDALTLGWTFSREPPLTAGPTRPRLE